MINWFLGIIAALMWVAAFAWYFAPDLHKVWRGRKERRKRAKAR